MRKTKTVVGNAIECETFPEHIRAAIEVFDSKAREIVLFVTERRTSIVQKNLDEHEAKLTPILHHSKDKDVDEHQTLQQLIPKDARMDAITSWVLKLGIKTKPDEFETMLDLFEKASYAKPTAAST